MNPGTLDSPMGNTELRITLAGIESEIGDVKSIAIETRDQAVKTNGSVANVKEDLAFWRGALWVMGAVIVFIVLPILGYALYQVVNIPTIVQTSIQTDLNNYNVKVQ